MSDGVFNRNKMNEGGSRSAWTFNKIKQRYKKSANKMSLVGTVFAYAIKVNLSLNADIWHLQKVITK